MTCRRPFSPSFKPLLLALGLVLVAGCPSREVAEVPGNLAKEEVKKLQAQPNRDLDLLFVIDDSGSMKQEQKSLAANFDVFIDKLQMIDGGLPNIHIGVISTNVGAGPLLNDSKCNASDGGQLQTDPQVPACTPPSDPYIVDIGNEDGSRTRNYNGDLQSTFSCIAQLGIDGCGFEQPLESMRQALDNNPANSGFLRPNAYLAVVLITDEDDCSARNNALFNPSDTSLGPIESFRCFEYGAACEPDNNPRAVGQRQNCVARTENRPHPVDDTVYLEPVQTYIDFLKGLKPADPFLIIVAGIVGNATPVAVVETEKNGSTIFEVEPSCESGAGQAFPSIRLQSFLNAFPQRSTQTSICNEDLSGALSVIAGIIIDVLSTPCLQGDLFDTDTSAPGVQPECTVSDVRFLDTPFETAGELVPVCNAGRTNIPCYSIDLDTAECNTETNLAITIERPAVVPSSTTSVVRCRTN